MRFAIGDSDFVNWHFFTVPVLFNYAHEQRQFGAHESIDPLVLAFIFAVPIDSVIRATKPIVSS